MKYSCLLLFFLCIYSSTFCQNTSIKPTENSVVKDSSGTVYPYFVWNLLVKRGDYYIKPVDTRDENTDFVLIKFTEEQKDAYFAKMSKPQESVFFKTGKEFYSFKTTDMNGNKVDIKAEKGKILVINFWFINCPPCRMEIPALNEIADAYKGNDSIRFIGIALDRRSELKEFLKTLPFKYEIVDDGYYIANRYGIRAYPTHVIVDQEGKVYFHTTGLGSNTAYWIKKSINELLTQSTLAKK